MTATTAPRSRAPFTPAEEQQLLDDDIQCSKSVLAVLLSVVIAGALAMAVTVVVVL